MEEFKVAFDFLHLALTMLLSVSTASDLQVAVRSVATLLTDCNFQHFSLTRSAVVDAILVVQSPGINRVV